MARKTNPDRADICIIGAGASGAAAAKILTEGGARVVALERGPWRKRESFGGDELANVNRYNLWPDPILNPRTVKNVGDKEPRVELFCPVPQMVGGGTVHWQGWLPRFTPNDFRLRTVAGELPGATLADWPITYDELEPYYTRIEWAFGVSGQAGANRVEGKRSKGYPCPPMPISRYAQKFDEAAGTLAGTPSRPRRRRSRAHSMAVPRLSLAPSRSSMAIRPAPGPARSMSLSPTRSERDCTTCAPTVTSAS